MAVKLIDLREGSVRDLSTVDRLMREAFDPRFGEAWTPAQSSGMLAMPGVWLTLASMEGMAVGFSMSRVVIDDAELLLLAVRPSARGNGVGRALLRSVLHDAGDRGAGTLHLEVRNGNPAIHLYRQEGFKKVGVRKNYYRGYGNEVFDAHSYSRTIA